MTTSECEGVEAWSWKRLVQDPAQVCNWHFSADPKPTRFLTELNGYHDVPIEMLNTFSDSTVEPHMQRFVHSPNMKVVLVYPAASALA